MNLIGASSKTRTLSFAVLTIGAFVATPAYAYVDPGSGQLLLQALGVVFFGALFYVRQIIAFFRRLTKRG